MNDRSRGAYRLQVARDAESLERGHAELLFEQARGELVMENPVVESRLDRAETVQFRGSGGREERRRPR